MTGALVTKRLLLRPAEPGDLDALAAIWADPLVMRHMRRGPRTRNESRDRLQG